VEPQPNSSASDHTNDAAEQDLAGRFNSRDFFHAIPVFEGVVGF
jgi:hypothetical protein